MKKLVPVGLLLSLVTINEVGASILDPKGFELYVGSYNVNRDDRHFMLGGNYDFRPSAIFSPHIGGFVSDKRVFYANAGLRIHYKRFRFSIGPGYYHQGDGQDLGGNLQFKSDIGFDITPNIRVGGFHLSNASTQSYNPGSESVYIAFSGF